MGSAKIHYQKVAINGLVRLAVETVGYFPYCPRFASHGSFYGALGNHVEKLGALVFAVLFGALPDRSL
ncbi:hypothetical protein [Reyranella soli]|nr:hypothetical protein [Reyranella soli]